MTEEFIHHVCGAKPFERLWDLLRRHVREDDWDLTDDAFVMAVMARYLADREGYLIDPNE